MVKQKKRYELKENETIDQCLDRMKQEGYTPVRRIEEPIFQEMDNNGQITYEPVGRKLVFDALPVKTEH